MTLLIRPEQSQDISTIFELNVEAFGSAAEASLVDALRANGALTLSLVAELDAQIVGHIAFSPVTVEDERGDVTVGMGLAPMCVRKHRQRTGIGGQLVREGLARLRADGHRFCVVLGHPSYYPRFGFASAAQAQLRWERPGHEAGFMVQPLHPPGLHQVRGVVRYRREFDSV